SPPRLRLVAGASLAVLVTLARGQLEACGLGVFGGLEPDLGDGAVVERRTRNVVEHRGGVALDLVTPGSLTGLDRCMCAGGKIRFVVGNLRSCIFDLRSGLVGWGGLLFCGLLVGGRLGCA